MYGHVRRLVTIETKRLFSHLFMLWYIAARWLVAISNQVHIYLVIPIHNSY